MIAGLVGVFIFCFVYRKNDKRYWRHAHSSVIKLVDIATPEEAATSAFETVSSVILKVVVKILASCGKHAITGAVVKIHQ